MGARMVDQNAPHELGGDAEELGAVLPLDTALIDHSQVCFVDERGRLKRVIAPLPLEIAPGQVTELLVNERH